jgi:hypothetical protein
MRKPLRLSAFTLWQEFKAKARARADARAGAQAFRAVLPGEQTAIRCRATSMAEIDLTHLLRQAVDAPDDALILEVLVSKEELKDQD